MEVGERERCLWSKQHSKKTAATAAANNTALGSKQGDGAFWEALGFLSSEYDLKD